MEQSLLDSWCFRVLYNMDISSWLEDHMMACPYKALSGLDCPGCGMQRSFIELLRGNMASSFELYPALLPVIFTLLLTAAHLFFRFRNGAALIKYSFLTTTAVIVISYIWKMCS